MNVCEECRLWGGGNKMKRINHVTSTRTCGLQRSFNSTNIDAVLYGDVWRQHTEKTRHFTFMCFILFNMWLTISESSSSSSQYLAAARGSPTTLSSPITPCRRTRAQCLMIQSDTVQMCRDGCLSLHSSGFVREFPLSITSEERLMSSVRASACEVSLSPSHMDDLLHVPTQDPHTQRECYLAAYQRDIRSVWRGAAELFQVQSGHIYVHRKLWT